MGRLEMATIVRRSNPLLLVMYATAIGCASRPLPRSEALAAQEAAIEFFSRQSTTPSPSSVCVRIASGPGEVVDGIVSKGLIDPPASLVTHLQSRGVSVRPYSTCNVGDLDVLLTIGWPTGTANGAQLPVDRSCGPGCGGGFVVDVRHTDSAWRAVGAHGTWIS